MNPIIELDLTLTDPEVRACPKVPVTLRLYCRRKPIELDMREWLADSWISFSIDGGPERILEAQDDTLISWAINQYIESGEEE